MPTSFAVEKTLGKLGTWLRLLGFDALFETDCPRGAFMGRIPAGRVLLTRTRRTLAAQAALGPVFIESNDPSEQLAEVIVKTGLRPGDLRPFSRCLRCNEPITPVSKEEIIRSVPEYVWQTQETFSRCPGCGRIYWKGTHTARSLERIEAIWETIAVQDSRSKA